jgi:hypothetical protein
MKITIDNFRTFGLNGKPAEFDIRPITILIGPNSSGKSSLLRALDVTIKNFRYGDFGLTDSDVSAGNRDGQNKDDIDINIELFSLKYRLHRIEEDIYYDTYRNLRESIDQNCSFPILTTQLKYDNDKSYKVLSYNTDNIDLDNHNNFRTFLLLLKNMISTKLIKINPFFDKYIQDVSIDENSISFPLSNYIRGISNKNDVEIKLDDLLYTKEDPNYENVDIIEKVFIDYVADVLDKKIYWGNVAEYGDAFTKDFIDHIGGIGESIDIHSGQSGSIADTINFLYRQYIYTTMEALKNRTYSHLYKNRLAKDFYLTESPEYLILQEIRDMDKTFDKLIKYVNLRLYVLNIKEKVKMIESNVIGTTQYFSIIILKEEKQLPLTAIGAGIAKLIWFVIESYLPKTKVNSANRVKSIFGDLQIDDNGAKVFHLLSEIDESLHPNLQSRIADLVNRIRLYREPSIEPDSEEDSKVDSFLKLNEEIPYQGLDHSFIIETHSEYMIRRFQTLVAKGELKSEDIIIYYFSDDPTSEDYIKPIEIKPNGFLSDDFGPGFMDEATNLITDLRRINRGQAN